MVSPLKIAQFVFFVNIPRDQKVWLAHKSTMFGRTLMYIFMFAMASWQVYLIFSSNLAESTLCGALFVEVSHGQKLDWITVTRELGDGHQSIVIGIDIPNMFGFPLWDGWPKLIYHVLTMVHMQWHDGISDPVSVKHFDMWWIIVNWHF